MNNALIFLKCAFLVFATLHLCACEKLNLASPSITSKKSTAIYSVQAPDGRIYEVEGPKDASEKEVINFLRSIIEPEPSFINMPSYTNMPTTVDLTINGLPVPCSVDTNYLKHIFPNRISISCP
jgi:hypothetical protein